MVAVMAHESLYAACHEAMQADTVVVLGFRNGQAHTGRVRAVRAQVAEIETSSQRVLFLFDQVVSVAYPIDRSPETFGSASNIRDVVLGEAHAEHPTMGLQPDHPFVAELNARAVADGLCASCHKPEEMH